ncbi:26S proteasome subunit RPN7-domain-containing protein [Chaetomium fimeti]|jgi:COP9 signalosome complex subunit 1|uniref:COP9 signalosome complex subunit 1 n=1 Tax=Chaetomium fimeti TaxID=1854472 RepID=A0AAE0HG22_9PEZI|nr:26S proteasome subunit RPN7-domain-containing protein [Chaetomium fimeti]
MADSLLAFFTLMDNQDGTIVREPPNFDLDLYIQSYRGRARFDRLFLIGRSSVPLCVDALKLAIAEAKRGKDTHRYREAVECLRVAAPSEPEAVFDQKWLEAQDAENKTETNRLLKELKGYKNNLIKESIRMGNEDLAKHLESIGDLNAASETYSKMRPDVSTAKQLLDVGKHLVRVSIQRREWDMVSAHLSKMGGAQSAEDEKAVQPYLKIAHGIAFLGREKFKDAALSFLSADSNIPSSTYGELASQSDVAIYGGLLALASMDRNELQTNVLDNAQFRTFLEQAPHIRRAVAQFVSGRYSACIAILESYRPDYLLDIYLQKHIAAIYSQIRSKCIIQYLTPFSCVSLDTMNKAFGGPDQVIEDELANMIQSGALQARINTIDKLVTTKAANPRAQMQDSALRMAENYEKQGLDRLRRMGLAAADLELKSVKKSNPFGSQSDLMLEETLG